MDYTNKEFEVNRIVSGCYIFDRGDLSYLVDRPSSFIKYYADIIYKKSLNEVKFEGFITKDQARKVLSFRGLLPEDLESKKKELDKQIENLKVKLYEEYTRPNFKQVNLLRKSLNSTKKQLNKLYAAEGSLDQYTMESYAVNQKMQYIISSCLKFLEGEVDKDVSLIEEALESISSTRLNVGEYKELARTEPWRSIWIGNKDNPFGYPSCEWTDEQKLLVFFSKMYDNVYESPDCPKDDIIEDDDLLDGWFIFQRRKDKQETKDKPINQRHANADSVFHPVNSPEDLIAIDSKNSAAALMVKKQRAALLKEKGKVREQDFQDRKLQILTQAKQERK